jgi:hypothetical protein
MRAGGGTSTVDFSTPASPFSELANLIPDRLTLRYSTPRKLGDFMNAKIRQSRGLGFYLLVTNISRAEESAIDNLLRTLDLDYTVRLTYEDALESLIIKLMPSCAHERTSRTFFMCVVNKITSLQGHTVLSVVGTGATRYDVPGKRSKEAEEGIMPAARGALGWPSVVFEVGITETMPALRCDAAWWLLNSYGKTRMLVVIKVTRNPFSMFLESWEMVPNPIGRPTRRNPATVPGCTQSVDIDAAGGVNPGGFQLRIPYLTIFDVPHPGAADITFPANELTEIALLIKATI